MAFRTKISHEENEENEKSGTLSAELRMTIAVAGCMSRIGATTQALHIASYLYNHYVNVAYVEMNDHGFIDLLPEVYEDVKKDRDGNTVYDNITLVKQGDLSTVINNSSYDCIVYDYGSITDTSFAPMFEEKNVQIIVGGTTPHEMVFTQRALEDPRFARAKVVFSFCPQDDQSAVLEQMTGRKSTTYFAKYSPDLFRVPDSMESVNQKILPETRIIIDRAKKKGRR